MTPQIGASLTDDSRVVIYDRNMFIIQAADLKSECVTPQFGASLTDDSRVVIYDRNMFIIQATNLKSSESDTTILSVTY